MQPSQALLPWVSLFARRSGLASALAKLLSIRLISRSLELAGALAARTGSAAMNKKNGKHDDSMECCLGSR